MRGKKKAVSPVVSTVLLVMIVIILAIIILLWSKGFIKEAVTKKIGGESKGAEQFCSEIDITPIIDETDDSFGFTNTGNVPIYAVNVKLDEGVGKSEIIKIRPQVGEGLVNPGFGLKITDPGDGSIILYTSYDEIKIMPIVLGKTSSGNVEEFECPERYSFLI